MEFEIAPPSTSVTMILGVISALTLLLTLLFGWIALTAANLSVAVEGSSLILNAPFYGRSISTSSLDIAAAEITQINKNSPIRPRIRTNGIGLPGYSVGWFRLKSGEKALLAVTGKNKVIYIPTHEGYSLLLSVKEPVRLLERLRSITNT